MPDRKNERGLIGAVATLPLPGASAQGRPHDAPARVAMPQETIPPAADEHDASPRLRGDLAMWLVIGMELLTFGLLFIVYAIARVREPEVFRAGQATLDLHGGALNTALLVTGSWCVARGVEALRRDRAFASARWTWAAAACGAGFMASKLLEYQVQVAAGADLSSDTFFMFYFMLTGFHFLHVFAAVLALAAIAWLTRRRSWGAQDTHAPETVAAFWHMVDLLWMVLFPLVYVLR